MVCEKCGKEHDGSFGSGRFCSRKCSNSRIITKELKEKISLKLRKIEPKFCKVCKIKLSRSNISNYCKKCKPKICSICEVLLTDKNSYHKTKDKLHSYCKKCFNSFCRDRWIKIKKWCMELKGGKCIKCGYNKYYGALEFHHVEKKDKEFNFKKFRSLKKEKLLKELNKCILLCSNCHKEEHASLYSLVEKASLF